MNLIYPPACLHCSEKSKKLFCQQCLDHLTLLSPIGRCSRCFCRLTKEAGTCQACRKKKAYFRKMAGCFESYGPASSLLSTFKEKKEIPLAKTIASFLAIQLQRQKWPKFDYLTYVPQPFHKHLIRGFNPSYRIAKALSRITGIPLAKVLWHKGGRLSSQYLPDEERAHFPRGIIDWRKSVDPYLEKSFLIIDDEAVTRGTLQGVAEALSYACPPYVYALTFCVYD